MDDFDDHVVTVRADTAAFARDVAAMRAELDGPMGGAAERAGAAIERGLLRAVRTGKLDFEDLKATALGVLAEIAAGALKSELDAILGRGASTPVPGGLLTLAGGLLGLPGRATGGPVSPGAAYVIGERGPEVFVPTASGRIEVPARGGREVRIALTINAPPGAAPAMLARSSRQVARAVRAALVAE